MASYRQTAVLCRWPAAVAVVTLWLALGITYQRCVAGTHGQFTYPLDDPYIHMAIARNFAQYRVWGITRYEFSSSTSSIAWPLLLSLADGVLGVHELTPLLLNAIFATAILLLAHAILRRAGVSNASELLLLLALIAFVPLPAVALTGMEHSLQVLVDLGFAWLAAREAARGDSESRDSRFLLVLAGLVSLVRFEGLFLVAGACLLLMVRRRWSRALQLAAAAAVPVVVYGAISAAHGWMWLPNSVLLKANVPQAFRASGIMPRGLFGALALSARPLWLPALVLLLLIGIGVRLGTDFWTPAHCMGLICVLALALHLNLASFGTVFSRYEAYLLVLGLVVLAWIATECEQRMREHAKPRLSPALILVSLVVAALAVEFLVGRGLRSFEEMPRVWQGSKNIHDQQYQMGLFLHRYYRGLPVAANDVGAVSYLSDARVLDLWGLGSLAVARKRMVHPLSPGDVNELARSSGVRAAIVYPELFSNGLIGVGGVPSSWRKVGEWMILRDVVCYGYRVSIYAVDPAEEASLTARLREFANRLPGDVVQMGAYVGGQGIFLARGPLRK